MAKRSTSIRAVLVEDNIRDQRFADRFSSAGLPCEVMSPSASKAELVGAISDGAFDLVILDYRLDDLPEVGYRGGSVAAELKEKDPLVPIALFTAAEKRVNFASRNPALSDVFDLVIEKESAQRLPDRRRVAQELADLAHGFREIREAFQRSRRATAQEILSKCMRARRGELPAQANVAGGREAGAHVARRILKTLLRYPGPLLDADKARALLGLAKQAFRKSEVLGWLEEARYEGVFSVLQERWWKGRVQALLIAASGESIPIASSERAKAVASACGVRALKSTKCNWCDEEDVVYGCEICGESVDGSHCLTVADEDRPSWADPLVVCFRCIQQGRAEGAPFVGPSEEIARKLSSGEMSSRVRRAG